MTRFLIPSLLHDFGLVILEKTIVIKIFTSYDNSICTIRNFLSYNPEAIAFSHATANRHPETKGEQLEKFRALATADLPVDLKKQERSAPELPVDSSPRLPVDITREDVVKVNPETVFDSGY